MLSVYPESPGERDRWVVARRPEQARASLDPLRPWAFFVEEERSKEGIVLPVATVFLTNRECPWRCLMCDLWKNTLTESVPAGAIPAQIDHALSQLALWPLHPARQIKLYNSGSFFDPKAIPVGDYQAIADRMIPFERVIVENHPALVGDSCLRFRDMLQAPLEVAMGLETVHPEILPRLNKRMSLEQFAAASDLLRSHTIDLRVFILVKPPFMAEEEACEWAARSVDFAFDCGATAITLIPTRAGNGAMDDLANDHQFSPPRLQTLEDSFDYGLGLHRGRVFVDLWDVKLGDVKADGNCPSCFGDRVARLRKMNFVQTVLPSVPCPACR